MLPFERIVKDFEVKKLSIETHKTLHTRDFRITIFFSWVKNLSLLGVIKMHKVIPLPPLNL